MEQGRLTPKRQGDFDRLCGIYSIINAIRWNETHLQSQPHKLFDWGLEYLIKRKKLNSVMLDGMTRRLWLKMAVHMLAQYNRSAPSQLVLEKLLTPTTEGPSENWDRIICAVSDGLPVLVQLNGAYSHFSVICGVTRRRVLLFDSGGQKWIQRRSCAIGKPDQPMRFWMNPQSLVVLKKDSIELN